MHWAIKEKLADTEAKLLSLGADAALKDKRGRTAHQFAELGSDSEEEDMGFTLFD